MSAALLRCPGAVVRVRVATGEMRNVSPGFCEACSRKVDPLTQHDMTPPGYWDDMLDFHCQQFVGSDELSVIVKGGQGRESIKA